MAFPQNTRLVSALKKAGAEVTYNGHKWYAEKAGRVVEWFTQAGFPNKDKLVAVCICSPSPDTDVQTDLFMDTFHHTIKEAVAFIA